jgi:CRISPR/Cas system-associated protein Cas7 (RAMP superfamily)
MTAAYGKQRQSHTFSKANKTGTCRHIEILATMAVHGAWQPSRTNSDADKKAFKRLQAALQAILPLPGDPFRKEGAQFHPLFELSLPKEHRRDSNEDIELVSEED